MANERVAIVTGASSGIGEASARALAEAGFTVALVARRGPRLDVLAKQIEASGGRALPIEADLADRAATSEVVRRTTEAYGRVDVLVNRNGFSPASHRGKATKPRMLKSAGSESSTPSVRSMTGR